RPLHARPARLSAHYLSRADLNWTPAYRSPPRDPRSPRQPLRLLPESRSYSCSALHEPWRRDLLKGAAARVEGSARIRSTFPALRETIQATRCPALRQRLVTPAQRDQ